jgi:hypothetical protein
LIDLAICKICGRLVIAWRTSHMKKHHPKIHGDFDDDFDEHYEVIKKFISIGEHEIDEFRLK